METHILYICAYFIFVLEYIEKVEISYLSFQKCESVLFFCCSEFSSILGYKISFH